MIRCTHTQRAQSERADSDKGRVGVRGGRRGRAVSAAGCAHLQQHVVGVQQLLHLLATLLLIAVVKGAARHTRGRGEDNAQHGASGGGRKEGGRGGGATEVVNGRIGMQWKDKGGAGRQVGGV